MKSCVPTDFNGAMGKLQETLQIVAGITQGIRSGSNEISSASDDLSRRTEQQAASLEETAAALDESASAFSGLMRADLRAAYITRIASPTAMRPPWTTWACTPRSRCP